MQAAFSARSVSPAFRRDAGDRYLDFLGVVLLGYALCNRGFAYVGVPPLFIGEFALLWGAALWFLHPIVSPLFSTASAWLLAALMAWGVSRTIPYMSVYGFDAIRDVMMLGYALFAFIVAALIFAKPGRLLQLLDRFRLFCYLFLILTPIVRVIVIAAGSEDNLPRMPGSPVSIICLRMGPVMIHLATITTFLSGQRTSVFWTLMIGLNFVMAATSRGGTLAFLATMATVMVLRPLTRTIWKLIGVAMLCFMILAVTGLEIQLDAAHAHRNISFNMFLDQISSIGGKADTGSFDDTKQWRLLWWRRIIDYTINGKYTWTGKGFGINLARDDGIPEADSDVPLRSPHNSHLTLLARGGLPALLLWALLNASWVSGMLLRFSIATRRGNRRWANVFLFLLAHWVAVMVSTSFDVYLEGPMGAIWFWVVFGTGWSACSLHVHRPLLLADPTPEPSPPTGMATIPAGGMPPGQVRRLRPAPPVRESFASPPREARVLGPDPRTALGLAKPDRSSEARPEPSRTERDPPG